MEPIIGLLLLVIVILVALSIILTFVPLGLWISALAAGVRIGIFNLIGMRLRRVIPSRIVNPLIKATKAGYPSAWINWRPITWQAGMWTEWSMP